MNVNDQSKKNGLEEAYDKCLKETVEKCCANYLQAHVQPTTSTPIKKTLQVQFDPVLHTSLQRRRPKLV